MKYATENEIKELVDELITPEYADVEAPKLIRLLLAVTDEKDRNRGHLIRTACERAFQKTNAYRNAFENFAPSGTREFTAVEKTLIVATEQ